MKISEAIKEMARIYQPGAIEWWAKQPIDRWQQNNDEWEAVMSDKDPGFVAASNILWLQKQKELLEIYEKVAPRPKVITPLDGFMLQGSGRTRGLISEVEVRCYGCGAYDVSPKRDGDNLILFCPKCSKPKQEKAK